jgi:hypothetical protein
MRVKRLAVLLSLLMMAGCAGPGGRQGLIATANPGAAPGWTPMKVLVLFPQVEPGAVSATQSAFRDVRPLMGAEMSAVAHAALKECLKAGRGAAWKDMAAEMKGNPRASFLAASIAQDFWANGAPDPRSSAQLGALASTDGLLIVTVFRYGPGRERLGFKDTTGAVVPDPDPKTPAGTTWVSTGLRMALVQASGGGVVWRGTSLDSRRAGGNRPQEDSVEAAMEKLVGALPYGR